MNLIEERDDTPHHELLRRRKLTFGERAADKMTKFLGSWTFIISFGVFLCLWIAANALAWWVQWDVYPFILLNLALSCLAAMQAPIIMMSQNREAERDRLQAKYDFAINRKAEREIKQVQIELKEIQTKLDKLISSKK